MNPNKYRMTTSPVTAQCAPKRRYEDASGVPGRGAAIAGESANVMRRVFVLGVEAQRVRNGKSTPSVHFPKNSTLEDAV
jgi:hypothetical protein